MTQTTLRGILAIITIAIGTGTYAADSMVLPPATGASQPGETKSAESLHGETLHAQPQTADEKLEATKYPLTADPDIEDPGQYLGKLFESKFQGIAFRGPANCHLLPRRSSAAGNEVAKFINEDEAWLMVVTRVSQENPILLSAKKDEPQTKGLLEMSRDRIRQDIPGVQILACDVGAVGQYLVGKIIYRYSIGKASWLKQMAIVQAEERLYYVITLTTPAGKTPADASEELADRTFKSVLDSVNILNMASISDEQKARLIRSRGLLMDWTERKITNVLAPRQWLRVQRNGKDVGWSYVEELTGRQRRALNGRPLAPAPDGQEQQSRTMSDDGLVDDNGFVIYTRSWVSGEAQHPEDKIATGQDPFHHADARDGSTKSLETGSETFLTFDRKSERFARVSVVTDAADRQKSSLEFGQSHLRTRLDFGSASRPDRVVPDPKDPRNPVGIPMTSYELSVQFSAKTGNARPVTHELPPFYVSDALVELLPRLVPLTRIHPDDNFSYMFCTYVHETQEIMTFYVDVGDSQQVTLGGATQQAVPVSVRLGYEGAPTVHYMTPNGHYIGTVIASEGITILPSDSKTLQSLWPKADMQLRQMEAVDEVVKNLRSADTNDRRDVVEAPSGTHRGGMTSDPLPRSDKPSAEDGPRLPPRQN